MKAADTTDNSICPKCGEKFYCGIAAGKETCWCFSFPKIMPEGSNAQCYCPACLQKETDRRLKLFKEK